MRVDTALRVAVLVRAGFTHKEIGERLDVPASKVRRAFEDL